MRIDSPNFPERSGSINASSVKPKRLIVVGASAGGISVLKTLLLALPQSFKTPIVIVQHFAAESFESLPRFFKDFSVLPTKEAEDKEPVQEGMIYFAVPNYHLLISKELKFELSVDDPVSFSRPAIDVLFETAAEALGVHVTGVVLTGANHDGAAGLLRIQRCGGRAVIQSPESAPHSTMPAAALKMVPYPDFMGDENEIAQWIVSLEEGGSSDATENSHR